MSKKGGGQAKRVSVNQAEKTAPKLPARMKLVAQSAKSKIQRSSGKNG